MGTTTICFMMCAMGVIGLLMMVFVRSWLLT